MTFFLGGGVFFGKNVDEENTFCGVSLSLGGTNTQKKKSKKTLNPKQETKRALSLLFVQIDPHTNKKRPPCAFPPAHDEQSFESENERERD